eukprot:m.191705 g.191705  ORF g.191705 m.191705 type:complete len:390 (+) comp53641_c0_seq28:568-1737(+)
MCARLQALKEWDRAHQGLEMPRAVQIEHDGDHGQWNKHWNLDRAKLQADDAHHCNLVEHDGSDNPPEDHGKIGGAAFKGRQIDVHHLTTKEERRRNKRSEPLTNLPPEFFQTDLILENKVAQRTETQHQNRNERRDRGVREADQHHENEVGKRRNVGELLWSVNGPLLLRSDSEQRLENWIDDQRNELQQLHRQPGQHLKHDEVHKEAVAAWYRRAHQRNNACWRIDELIQLRKGAACDDCDEKRIDHLEVAHLSGRFPLHDGLRNSAFHPAQESQEGREKRHEDQENKGRQESLDKANDWCWKVCDEPQEGQALLELRQLRKRLRKRDRNHVEEDQGKNGGRNHNLPNREMEKRLTNVCPQNIARLRGGLGNPLVRIWRQHAQLRKGC